MGFLSNLRRRLFGLSADDKAALRTILAPAEPFDLIRNATNLVNFFALSSDEEKNTVASMLLHAGWRTTKETGYEGTFTQLIAGGPKQGIQDAYRFSLMVAQQNYTDKDTTLALMCDAYSSIALLCAGSLSAPVRNSEVMRCVAHLYAGGAALKGERSTLEQ